MSNSDLSSVQWRKSTRSGGQGGECVELASLTVRQVRIDRRTKSARSTWYAVHSGECCADTAR